MLAARALTYRPINPATDADLCLAHYIDAHALSLGPEAPAPTRDSYLPALRERIEEYPDGHVLAFLDGQCVGQLEMQIPFGLLTGYINLYYVVPGFRGLGFGTLMHGYVDRYFRAWDATEIELHVARTNMPALAFYRKLGYRYAGA
jgi:ribosomal protein S18 acetylase RimI-like enzyme